MRGWLPFDELDQACFNENGDRRWVIDNCSSGSADRPPIGFPGCGARADSLFGFGFLSVGLTCSHSARQPVIDPPIELIDT